MIRNFVAHVRSPPRVRGGYELATIISYPTSASRIIVLLKTPAKYREFSATLFAKQPIFSLFFILSRRVQSPYLWSMV